MALFPLERLRRAESGSVTILFAASMVAVFLCAAFAVDAGSLYFERRSAQGAVDLAAIAAAADPARAETRARDTLNANRVGAIKALKIVPGRYHADPAVAPENRFVEGASPANAVRVEMTRDVGLHFARIIGEDKYEIGVAAVAVTTAQAAFSIGSRLARLDGGIVNALLGALLGGNVSLTLADYERLADLDIGLFKFMDAFATELDLGAASYDEVLNTEASVGQVLDAMATVATAEGRGDAGDALHDLAAQSGAASVYLPLARMIDLGPYAGLSSDSPAPGLSPSVNALQMVSAAAALANGEHQVALDLGATVPGLAAVTLDIAIGEPLQASPWLSVGERGATIRTAQIRVKLTAAVGGSGALSGIAIKVPLYAEAAFAEARIDDIACHGRNDSDARVDIAARPGVAQLWLGDVATGDLDNFGRRPAIDTAELVKTPLLRVTGGGHAQIANISESILSFDAADIRDHAIKRVSVHEPVRSLLDSLLRGLTLKVKVLGLDLGLPAVTRGLVATALSAATPAIDKLLSSVLDTLGLTLGEADVSVHGVRCDGAVLVG